MKTNGFKTGNVLRDLFMQSHLHGYEFMDLVCNHFQWSQLEFKEKATGIRIFSPDDM